MFDVFGPQLNAFMSVGILLQCFRHKLFRLDSAEFSYVPLSLTKLCSAASFFSQLSEKNNFQIRNYLEPLIEEDPLGKLSCLSKLKHHIALKVQVFFLIYLYARK